MAKRKINSGAGNNSERDSWQTPQELFNKLNNQYNFELDCCANIDNSKCSKFSDDFQSVISVWQVSWMNPPFSRSYKMFEHFFNVVNKGVAIYRCDNMETKVWQDLILKKANWILIPKKRVIYKGLSNKWDRPVFASALIGLGVNIPKNIEGCILFTKTVTNSSDESKETKR